MKRLLLYLVAIVVITIVGLSLSRMPESAVVEPVSNDGAEAVEPKTKVANVESYGRGIELPSKSDFENVVELEIKCGDRLNYTALYDTERYASLWVAYVVTSEDMGDTKRPTSWSYNPLLSTSKQVNLCSRSYNDDYSRGHLIPNASRNARREEQEQTFYVTNSVPQIQNGFNGGVWMHLESAVQRYAEREPLYVATGVVFEPVGESCEIRYTTAKDDTKPIPVPNYFYKVVLRVERNASGEVVDAGAIGFWFEHRAYSDKYYNYAMSVDEVERLTGFDFFASLPDDVEARAERNAKNFLR
ncbi:MAG: DNA/RNA non-specific endonuclease [Alistipes sp.]|nr:DNA/RNA non-specific endonuclease [Alistipes sp.]